MMLKHKAAQYIHYFKDSNTKNFIEGNEKILQLNQS